MSRFKLTILIFIFLVFISWLLLTPSNTSLHPSVSSVLPSLSCFTSTASSITADFSLTPHSLPPSFSRIFSLILLSILLQSLQPLLLRTFPSMSYFPPFTLLSVIFFPSNIPHSHAFYFFTSIFLFFLGFTPFSVSSFLLLLLRLRLPFPSLSSVTCLGLLLLFAGQINVASPLTSSSGFVNTRDSRPRLKLGSKT